MERKQVLAICGSTRSDSSNLRLIEAIADLSEDKLVISIFQGLVNLPQFNPDLDNEHPPAAVTNFREQLNMARGILICTPEYAMGVPGSLKNALDWTVSSCEFSHKPVAVITASSLGEKAHESLLGTLRVIEADVHEETQLLISYIKTKMTQEGKIVDNETLEKVHRLIDSFTRAIEGK